ncbi:MAG: hypothetical protein A3C61_00975 [Candidatus Yanofskybacteria bacterium RIFCSPHIGHO2_02_FULL_39_10]|uniref:Uncharacterized protein n=1 Tax=Candidatus Yanofskybacteria bacterium RIFCSPHIGHO2_02_FULL_39_10 TaxID=1802674 RepID=A0A1F8F7J1_9BACT|nr:MAG: hypothetical protein A3C61_00975 [Candidatus Yanofskybacteria bacterium RIFCSPHIGHO2_02_FULL_39_10]
MGKQTTALATVQVPSTDLIRGDNEFLPPEPYIPEYMDSKEFEAYKYLIGDRNHCDNVSFIYQDVLQILVKLDIRVYPTDKVCDLLNKQLNYYQKTVNKDAFQVIWRPTTDSSKYELPIPARIIKLMQQLQAASGHWYFKGDRDPYGRFVISDISKSYGNSIFADDRSLICFLAIELYATSGSNTGYQSRYFIIIDAWRGPTFSDEEAKI